MKTSSEKQNLHFIAAVSAALGVVLVFLPVVYSDFGIYDALRMALDFAWTGESRLTGVMMGGGRFVYAWMASIGFSGMHSIGDLWTLRCISVLSLAGCSLVFTLYACHQGWRYLAAVCIGLLAIINPGTAVYGFWSACFPYGLAILTAFISGILWARTTWKSRLISIFLMQFSLMVYQPAALYFFLGPFLAWFGDGNKEVRPFAAVWCGMGILLNLLIHLVLVRFILGFMPEIPVQSERLIEGGLILALKNVIVSVIPRVFAGWGDLLAHRLGLGMILIHVIGWLLFFVTWRDKRDRMLRILCLVPIALTLLPALISANGYAPYRLLAPAYCGVGVIALAGFSRGFRSWYAFRFIPVTGFGIVLLVAGTYSIQFGIVKPRVMEISVVQDALKEFSSETHLQGLVVVRPRGTYPVNQHILQKAEYGSYELSYHGFSEAFLSLIAADLFNWPHDGDNPINRIHWIFCPETTEAVPPFYPVLDLRVSLQGMEMNSLAVTQGVVVHHPYLGDTLYFPPSLYLSPGLGLTQQEADDWFFKPGLGWMQWTSDPGILPLEARDTRGVSHYFECP